MGKSHNDGRRGGGHACQGKELWSRRCPHVNMDCKCSDRQRKSGNQKSAKEITHRYERRHARDLWDE